MAIEKSIFESDEMIYAFLEKQYGLHAFGVRKMEMGSANCFRIHTENDDFFLKEFQSKFDEETLKREISVCEKLGQSVPTSCFVKNRDGKVICAYEGHLLHLQSYIDGIVLPQNSLDEPQLQQEAQLLGKLHRALADGVFLPDGFPEEWYRTWSSERAIGKYRRIREDHETMHDPLAEQITAACRQKEAILKQYVPNISHFMRLTKGNSHGDYNNQQLIFDGQGKIRAVIDFSSAAYLPVAWEIIRSYTLSAKECTEGNSIDLPSLKRYIDAYLTEAALILYDVRYMAEFYFYHMLRSAFGLNARDRKTAEFGLWRTRLCEYLYEKHQEIGEYLYQEYRHVLL